MSSSWKRPVWIVGAIAVVVASVGVAAVVLARPRDRNANLPEAQARADEREGRGTPAEVTAVHPINNSSLRVSVEQLLSVEPFFETELRTQVAGRVLRVPKSIGAPVREGDLLVEIAVPDLDQEVQEKNAVIRQRQSDVALARAQIGVAEAQATVARELVEQRKHELNEATETREFRKIRYDRYASAVKEKAVQESVTDEMYRDYRAAYYAVLAAGAAVKKAEADVKEKESILASVRTDVELKETLVQVARKDSAQAQALDGYARITAPFDGVITDRNVVEGTFVQNSSSGHTEPMMTVARTDIVTAVMKVPDNFARYVSRNTEAVLRLDDHPDILMRGRVTRFSPSIRNRDRTMRVEVDLWNDTPANYQKFAAKCVSSWLAPLAAPGPFGAASLMSASDQVWSKNSKDRADPFPMLPIVTGTTDGPVTILPGASGYMRLNLRQLKNSYLLPNSAVFSRGGKPYILEVRAGKSHLVPVRVQVNDGRWAKVSVIVQEGDAVRGKPEVAKPLTGDETVILNRQVEIGDGQPVDVTFVEP